MRSLLSLVLLLAVVFVVVGEFFGGWYLGIPPHTPIFVYKKTHIAEQSRRTTAQQFTFGVEGSLSRGTLIVEAGYEQPASFQTGRPGVPERVVYRAEFAAGQRIAVSETLRHGQGIYRVRLIFDDATGTLRLTLPEAGTL